LACLGFAASDNPGKDQLRAAYKKAALRWHPDRHQNHGNEEEAKMKFQELSAAFESLQCG
jgi:DnaJ-class molecular chaperone